MPSRVKQLVDKNIVPVEFRSQLWSLALGKCGEAMDVLVFGDFLSQATPPG